MLRVHYQDTDQMGVVHHANYVSWFEIGRTEMMRDTGFAYSKIEELGLLLPVLDLNITYQKPAHYDDYLAIYTKVTTYSAVRLEFAYEVRRIKDEAVERSEEELLASGSTLHMWLNDQWKPARIDKIAPSVFELIKQK